MNPSDQPSPEKSRETGLVLRRLSAEDLAALNEEIAGMARAGLPLDQGLASLAREMGRGRLQRVTADLAADLASGHSLPDALERQGGKVPPFYAGLVAAGVRTGRLSDVLTTLTIYARTLSDLRSTVLSALYYPVVVMVLALVLFGFWLVLVVPQFEKIFMDFRMRLPAVTEGLLFVSRHPLAFLVLPPVLLFVGVVLLRLALRTSEGGRRVWALLVYSIPLVGTLVRSARLAAFTDLLGILVDHKVPIPEAFRLAGVASSDPLMAAAARQVEQDLAQGKPLGEVLARHRLVPELVAWMTRLGEERSNLGPSLHQVAQLYRRQVEMRATVLQNILPPLLVILTAGFLMGVFAIAVAIPMIKLMEGLSGGM